MHNNKNLKSKAFTKQDYVKQETQYFERYLQKIKT